MFRSSAFVVFAIIFVGVSMLGFAASRWGSGDRTSLEEWGLAGRGFGTVVSWFLLGGDLYTAYTFVALPAFLYGAGAIGFFAVPYTTLAYIFFFVVVTRFWVVARNRGYVTLADFIRDRYGDRRLEVAVALTCVAAALPYVALQLVGMQAVLTQFGAGSRLVEGSALFVAFAIVAAYTYICGLRGPALVAFVKDTLMYVTIVAAMIIIPAKLGGWRHIFSAASVALGKHVPPGGLLVPPNMYFAYATLALGSASTLFMYPHSITSALSAKSKRVIERNAVFLPLYSILLAMLALMGYCALAAGIHLDAKQTSLAVPLLLKALFPGWLAGVAFAAIVTGALVPAAVMAIGAANLFASNVLAEFTQERPPGETQRAKFICLAVLAAALVLVLTVPVPFAINFQLLGGAWMMQIFPVAAMGLYTRWFNPHALLAGWAVGIACTTAMAIATGFKSTFALGGNGLVGYIGFYGFVLNLAVAAGLTLLLRATGGAPGVDRTVPADYA
jgi:solute:Na+ symporter, SSS family